MRLPKLWRSHPREDPLKWQERLNNKEAFIATEMTLKPGVVVTLEIDVPGSTEPETVRGVVARRARDSTVGLGIEFLPTTVDERDHIPYVVMTILALDLLAYETRPEPADARAFVPPASRIDRRECLSHSSESSLSSTSTTSTFVHPMPKRR